MTDYIAEKVAAQNAAPAEERPLDETFESVFARWFQRFNAHDSAAKALPHPGYISLEKAVGLVLEHRKLATWPREALKVVERVQCITRHMHAQPTELPRFWASGEYTVDCDAFRVRRPSDADQPPNWFAVQVDEAGLRTAIEHALHELAREDEDDLDQGDAADRLDAAATRMGEISAMAEDVIADAQRTSVPPHLRGVVGAAIRRAEEIGYASSAADMPTRPPTRDELELDALKASMPTGWELVVTPRGFVAVFRSQPQSTAVQALRDSWFLYSAAELFRKETT